jgi:hypothetical protein
MKSVFEMALTKSLLFVLSPRMLFDMPLMFQVLNDISRFIRGCDLKRYMKETAMKGEKKGRG